MTRYTGRDGGGRTGPSSSDRDGVNGRGFHVVVLEHPGDYFVAAVGAQGGTGGYSFEGGRGARVEGVITVAPSEAPKTLTVIVGQMGKVSDRCAGGGGGSFVFAADGSSDTPLTEANLVMVAGGGGAYGVNSNVFSGFRDNAHASAKEEGRPGLPKRGEEYTRGSGRAFTLWKLSDPAYWSGGGKGAGVVERNNQGGDDDWSVTDVHHKVDDEDNVEHTSIRTPTTWGHTPDAGALGGSGAAVFESPSDWKHAEGGFGGGGGAAKYPTRAGACGGGGGYRGGGGGDSHFYRRIGEEEASDAVGGGGGSKNNADKDRKEWSGATLEQMDSEDGRGDGYVEISLFVLHVQREGGGNNHQLVLDKKLRRAFPDASDVADMTSDGKRAFLVERQRSEAADADADAGGGGRRRLFSRFHDVTFQSATVQEALNADEHIKASHDDELGRLSEANLKSVREIHKARQLATSEALHVFRKEALNDGLLVSLCILTTAIAVVGFWRVGPIPKGVALVLTSVLIAAFVVTVIWTGILATSRSRFQWRRMYRSMRVRPDEEE